MSQQVETMPNSSLMDGGKKEITMRKEASNFNPNHGLRKFKEACFHGIICLATLSALGVLFILVFRIFNEGWTWLDAQFLDSFPSRFPHKAGIKSAIWGSIWLGGMTLLFSVTFGVGAAIYLEELSPKNRINKWLEINIATLAGVPSIIYGMLGLTIFVRFMALERSVVSGALTLSLLVMPVIIIATREALKSVPDSTRFGAAALGASKWQSVRDHVLPSAFPGILTGIILAMARAAGEAAPLIMIGALTYVAFTPEGPMDAFTALPIQIFNWTSRPQIEFHELAAAGIIVLLGFLIVCNSLAIILRLKWKEEKR